MLSLFGVATPNRTATWHPEPTYRGTYGVLSPCLVTLGLCLWTALHPNVPEHGKAHWQKWIKLGWLITSFLAPEIVFFRPKSESLGMSRLTSYFQMAWNAFEQHKEAKIVQLRVRKAFRHPPEPGTMQRLARQPGRLARYLQRLARHLWRLARCSGRGKGEKPSPLQDYSVSWPQLYIVSGIRQCLTSGY